jgi:predicted NodU family carbamoyl transferase
MKDGYYLSCYINIGEIPNLTNMLIRHDQNISLFLKKEKSIILIHYWELERISGFKQHQTAFYNFDEAVSFINSLLSIYNLCIDDMNEVWGLQCFHRPNSSFEILKEIDDYALHSIFHLYSGIFSDSSVYKNNSIVGLAVDGGPDGILDNGYLKKNQFCGGIFENGKVIKLLPVQSPGLLYEIAAKHFQLKEGTLMALSSASKSELINFEFQAINMFNSKDIYDINESLDHLLTYVDNLKNDDMNVLFNYMDPQFTDAENRISMVMKEVQKYSIKVMEQNIDSLLCDYPKKPCNMYLSVTGGYALNCPTNTHLINKYGFKGFLAPPCVSDTGISLGIALYVFKQKINEMDFTLKNAFYGDEDKNTPPYNHDDYDFSKYIYSVNSFGGEQAIKDIIEGPIIWFDSRAEMGPRALGHRSILCDPRNAESKKKLNEIKQRQWWRPVAPIVLHDSLNDWFSEAHDSPYMLHAFYIKDEKASLVEAILHLDGTARVQTLGKESDEDLYNFILLFYHYTGIPMIGNTSLNDRGEPIIDSIPQAINFALRKGIKIIYANKNRIELHNHNLYPEKLPLKRNEKIWTMHHKNKNEILKDLNPLFLDEELLAFYYRFPLLMSKYNIKSPNDVDVICRLKKKIYNTNAFR